MYSSYYQIENEIKKEKRNKTIGIILCCLTIILGYIPLIIGIVMIVNSNKKIKELEEQKKSFTYKQQRPIQQRNTNYNYHTRRQTTSNNRHQYQNATYYQHNSGHTDTLDYAQMAQRRTNNSNTYYDPSNEDSKN